MFAASPPRKSSRHLARLPTPRARKNRVSGVGCQPADWPETIETAVESVETADFLTPEQRRDIFFNNALRFFRLNPDTLKSWEKTLLNPDRLWLPNKRSKLRGRLPHQPATCTRVR